MPSDVSFPSGGIILWSGAIANIPQGWFLCDGNNGTPNLSDCFVIHADADSGGTRDVGDTGGSHTTDLQHSHGGVTSTKAKDGTGEGPAQDVTDAHNHDIANDLSTTQATIPKFHALAYIMKS